MKGMKGLPYKPSLQLISDKKPHNAAKCMWHNSRVQVGLKYGRPAIRCVHCSEKRENQGKYICKQHSYTVNKLLNKLHQKTVKCYSNNLLIG